MRTILCLAALSLACSGAWADDYWTRQPVESGAKPDPKRWRDVVGREVVVEGIAWAAIEKGLGERVLMDGVRVYVDGDSFWEKKVHGRLVRVTGTLELVKVAKAPPNAQGYAQDFEYYRLKRPAWEELKEVTWPWMRETR